ncbi:MAG TPA: hypothetical protein VIJ71_09665 [Mycobacteriales bacterium]
MRALRLPDGTPVRVRPMVHGDRLWLGEAVERLTPESRYLRFLSPLRTLDDAMLTRLVDSVDGVDHVAVVATLSPGEPEAQRGAVARYIRLPDERDVAELAITVTDVLQGRGLGSLVGRWLADHALRSGVTTFGATIAASNTASIKIMGGLGEIVRQDYPSPGVLDIRVLLGSET